MTKKLAVIYLITCSFLCSNCVTILAPKTQKLTINTNNPKSTVSINGEVVGKGATIETKIKKDTKPKQIKVETPGHKTTHYSVLPTKIDALTCVSCLFSIPIIYVYAFDASSSKSLLYPKSVEALAGKKKKTRQGNDKYIDVNEVKFDIKEKDFKFIMVDHYDYINKIEKIESSTKKNKSTISFKEDLKVDNTIFSSQLSKILKGHGYIDTINQIFKDQANSLSLKANVKTMTFYLISSTVKKPVTIGGYSPTNSFIICKSDIEWNLLNSYGEILKSVTVRAQSGEFNTDTETLDYLGDMIENSLDLALSNKSFSPFLQVEPNVDAKLALTTLSKPASLISSSTDVEFASVIVKTEKGHGSGFAISNDGYIITNYHVIASEDPAKQQELTIIMNDGTKAKATIVKYNKYKDLALLKVEQKFEKCFELPTQKNFSNLEEVFAMGAPRSVELGQSASKGIISSERNYNNINLIQTNMSINSGNSGGPMFNKDGKLYGVVTAKLFGIGVEGVAFCIPAYKIQEYLSIDFK